MRHSEGMSPGQAFIRPRLTVSHFGLGERGAITCSDLGIMLRPPVGCTACSLAAQSVPNSP